MKKLLVIGVLMSVMLVGCGTQKETTAVEDSTVSNVVAEAVTEVLTETTEAVEETTEVVEETTTEAIEEETTTVEEITEEVIEETTVVEETVVEEVVEEPVVEDVVEEPVVEEPAPVEEAPAEEPAPAPASTGSTWKLWGVDDAESLNYLNKTASDMGLSVTVSNLGGGYFNVTVNSSDAAVVDNYINTVCTWGFDICF